MPSREYASGAVRAGSRGPGGKLATVADALLLAALAAQAAWFLFYSWRALAFPYPLDYGEGPILQLARELAEGRSLYPPIDRPPYLVASYEPAYQLLCALGVRLFGVQFWFGRLVSVLSVVATAAAAGLVVWELTRQRRAALVAAGAILAMPHVVVWGSFMRVDALALAFAATGFWLFLRGARAGAGLLFALGVFTRRTTVAALGASYLEYALDAGLWRAFRAGVLQSLLVALLLLGANRLSQGGLWEHLSLHTATSLGSAWALENAWWLLWSREGPSPLSLWGGWFVLGPLAAAWALGFRPARALVFWFVLAWLVYLTSGRIGAAHNYFMEPTAVGAMLFGVMYGTLTEGPGRAVVAALSLALVAQMGWTALHAREAYAIMQLPATAESSARVVELLRQAEGPALVEDTGLALVAGKEPPLMPFEFTMMARAGALDPAPVHRAAREGRYPLIVLRFDPFDPAEIANHRAGEPWQGGRWTEEIIAAVQSGYRLAEKTGPYYVFVPAPRAAAR